MTISTVDGMARVPQVAVLAIISGLGLLNAQTSPEASPSASPAPQKATIRFFADVNSQTIASLIEQVEGNIRAGKTDITLNISSGGGDPMAALAAFQYLRGRPITLTTHNFGQTASAAIILFAAGTKRYSTSLGSFVIHEPMANPLPGLATDVQLSEVASILKLETNQMALVLAEVTGKSQETTTGWIKNHSVWDAKEALRNNLIQDIRNDIQSDKVSTAGVVGEEKPSVLSARRGQNPVANDVVRTTDRIH